MAILRIQRFVKSFCWLLPGGNFEAERPDYHASCVVGTTDPVETADLQMSGQQHHIAQHDIRPGDKY
jgi:hypothetical protein